MLAGCRSWCNSGFVTFSRTKKPRSSDGRATADARAIDELYGLEPLFEPDSHEGAGGAQSQSIGCPYCGESFETVLDLSAGSASYIEDCQVCCRPIEFRLEVDHEGGLVSLGVSRVD
jgi:hypothetical protein